MKIKNSRLKRWINLQNKGKIKGSQPIHDAIVNKQMCLDQIQLFLNQPKRVCTSLQEIKRHFANKFAPNLNKISLSTISKWVKRAGYSRKRLSAHIKDRNSAEMLKERKTACYKFAQHLKEEKEPIYIDEVSFNQEQVQSMDTQLSEKRL